MAAKDGPADSMPVEPSAEVPFGEPFGGNHVMDDHSGHVHPPDPDFPRTQMPFALRLIAQRS